MPPEHALRRVIRTLAERPVTEMLLTFFVRCSAKLPLFVTGPLQYLLIPVLFTSLLKQAHLQARVVRGILGGKRLLQYNSLLLFPQLFFEFLEIERAQQPRELVNGLRENCQPQKAETYRKRVYTRTIFLQEHDRFGAEFDYQGVVFRKGFAELGRFHKDLLESFHNWAHASYGPKHIR